MATLIFSPGLAVRQICGARRDLVFLDADGWWVWDGTSTDRVLVDVFSIPIDWGGHDLTGVLQVLRADGPTWSRWVGQADSYEMLYRESLVYILHLMAGLRHFGIRSAVFHTSVSHHLDTSFVEIACAQRGVPQVYLYNTSLDGRILPIVQRQSIADRAPLGILVSEQSATSEIATFVENKLAGRRPVHNQPVKRYYLSPTAAVAYAVLSPAQRFVRRMLRNRTGRSQKFWDDFPGLSFGDQLRLVRRQKRALDFYDRHCEQVGAAGEPWVRSGKGPALLIAAHFQPEAACYPEGGAYNNHLDIVLALREMGCQEPILYKEHFASYRYFAPIIGMSGAGMYRSVAYFERLQNLGCKFLPPSMPLTLDEAGNHWYLPVTMTGTVALERSLFGLPSIYAGRPWYAGVPGATHISGAMALLAQGSEVTRKSADTARQAFEFLDAMLSRKTILNVPGIGTGEALSDRASMAVFDREFSTLLSKLPVASATALEAPTGRT